MLDMQTRVVDGVNVLDLSGSINQDGVKALKEKLQELRKLGVTALVVNFEGVKTVQSAILQQLVTPLRAQVGVGAKIAFCAMNPAVEKLIAASMIKPMIDIHESLESAVKDFNAC